MSTDSNNPANFQTTEFLTGSLDLAGKNLHGKFVYGHPVNKKMRHNHINSKDKAYQNYSSRSV